MFIITFIRLWSEFIQKIETFANISAICVTVLKYYMHVDNQLYPRATYGLLPSLFVFVCKLLTSVYSFNCRFTVHSVQAMFRLAKFNDCKIS